jgi:restriction endonuclease S subunit
MITYSIIKKSQLEGGHRLDAEYYRPEYLKVAEKVSSLPHETLEDISESIVSFGAYALTNFIEWQEGGIPFIVAENIKEGFISYEGVRYITDKTDEILKKSRVHEEHVLLSMSGSVGNAAVAYKIPSRLNSNQDIVKIRLKKNFSPYFLAAFLNSKYGRMQVLRLPVGSVQQHIFLWQTKSLLVPILLASITDRVEKIYKEGLEQLEASESLYSQAEDLLLEELGLKNFKLEEELSYIVNLSDIKLAHRTDAEYFQPKYERLIKNLGKDKQNLKLIAKRKTKKAEILAENDYKYIEISDVDVGSGEVTFNIVKGSNLPANAKMKIEGGELIVSKVRPTRGAVGIIPDDCDESFVASGAFSIFEVVSPTREYLQVILRSIVGGLQLEKPTTGTSYPTVTDEDIEELIIPILSKSVQQKIADLVRQSQQAHKKAKELLEKAKREVENFIESNSRELGR